MHGAKVYHMHHNYNRNQLSNFYPIINVFLTICTTVIKLPNMNMSLLFFFSFCWPQSHILYLVTVKQQHGRFNSLSRGWWILFWEVLKIKQLPESVESLTSCFSKAVLPPSSKWIQLKYIHFRLAKTSLAQLACISNKIHHPYWPLSMKPLLSLASICLKQSFLSIRTKRTFWKFKQSWWMNWLNERFFTAGINVHVASLNLSVGYRLCDIHLFDNSTNMANRLLKYSAYCNLVEQLSSERKAKELPSLLQKDYNMHL